MSKTHIPTPTTAPVYGTICRSANVGGGYFAHYKIVTSPLFNHFISAPLAKSGDLSRCYRSPLATAIGVYIGQIRCINC